MKEVAKLPDEAFPEIVKNAAHALMLNLRAADAAELLAAQQQHPGLLAEVNIARLRYADALKDIDQAGADERGRILRIDYDLRRARVMALTGDRAGAAKLFAQSAATLTVLPDPVVGADWTEFTAARRGLIRSELRAGFRELACEHAGGFLAAGGGAGVSIPESRTESLFDLLFGADADAADALFQSLRTRPGIDGGTAMKRVRELLLGTAPPAAVTEALGALGGDLPPPPAGVVTSLHRRQLNRLTATALVARAARRDAEAEAAFARAAGFAAEDPVNAGSRAWVFGTSDAFRPWVEYGDFLADLGRHADAAARYEEGWKKFPDAPLLLFLSGRALAKAGRADEGRRRMDLAHWVPLGNERLRGKFLEDLNRRGEAKAAARETDLLLRACWSRDFYFGNVMNQAGRAAVLNKDWATAERCVQRAIFVLLKTPDVTYVDPGAYLHVPHDMLGYRARAALAAGDVPAAMTLARQYLDVTPGAVELVSGVVPELEKRGKTAEADELFGRVWAAHRKVLGDFPNSASSRNALAALGANCRRELDAARAYAVEAVAADPKSMGYRETLAEVHFRRGERAEAVKLMEALAAESPRSRLYRRQLARYRTADPASPLPEAED